METRSSVEALLASPVAYRIWQGPFAKMKLMPVFRTGMHRSAKYVLDVGCGPGTNTSHFAHAGYLGIDLSPEYIAYARKRYGRNFLVADITSYVPDPSEPFDFVLMNSLLHHIDDDGVRHILGQLARIMTAEGRVHILDLVLPESRGVARFLARADRGHHARPLSRWRELFTTYFQEEAFEPYPLGVAGLTLWEMVYFRGGPKA